MERPDLELAPMGDGALRFRRAPGTDARALLAALRAWPFVIDAVVTEEHACVTFDPARPPISPWSAMDSAVTGGHRDVDAAPRLWTLRVRYDGPDLEDVARTSGLAPDEVIRRHAARVYDVVMVGFLPGFAYLASIDPALVVPRRATPRARVDACAVGIAAGYTGIYPCASAGGWNLLGHALDFAPFGADGARLALGDRVRFEPAP
jgi:UPF0271 protein